MFKQGDKVTYNPTGEQGVVKGLFNNGVYVVFDCGGHWSKYHNYTSQRCEASNLSYGWDKNNKKHDLGDLIHWGDLFFKDDKFEEIKNKVCSVKPIGGLWTSPIDSLYGWKDWVKENDFHTEKYNCGFVFNLNDEAKVFEINSPKEIMELPLLEIDVGSIEEKSIALIWGEFIDFEKTSEIYDAIHLTEEGQERTRFGKPSLYGWDCETVLVLNKEAIDFSDFVRL